MHELEKGDNPFAMHEYDAINVRTVHFTTNVKYTHNANIAFDEQVIGNFSIFLQM